ncbi:unnamed protein product, partial [marine sediment metagenome]
ESNDARVIVHWRYALIDTHYRQARVDPITKWGDWSDEYYIIYPDGVGIRDITLHSSQPMEPHEFQESIVIIGEGMTPEDVYDLEAVTFFNMKGESYTYSWEIASPKFFLGPNVSWYPFWMYRKGSPQHEYHVKHYGDPSEFGYKDLIPLFKAEKF